MRIDILSETTLKLTLTEEDLRDSRLCRETLSGESRDCRMALEQLIEKNAPPKSAAMAAALLEESKLLVETFPSSDGGCMVYLSALNRGRSKNKQLKGSSEAPPEEPFRRRDDAPPQLLDSRAQISPIILETDSGEQLGSLCRSLLREKARGASFESRLFSRNGRYRLALIPLNACTNSLLRILREYGEPCRSELTAAYTQEYFKVISEKDAAEICGDFF